MSYMCRTHASYTCQVKGENSKKCPPKCYFYGQLALFISYFVWNMFTGNEQHGQDTSASPVVSIFCLRPPVLASQQPCGSRRRPQRTREEKLDDFLQKGCGCRTECYKQITREHYLDTMERCAELTHDQLDLVLLGQLMANIHLSEVVGPQSNHAASPTQLARVDFHHHGRKFCRSMFLMLHGIGKSCFGVK